MFAKLNKANWAKVAGWLGTFLIAIAGSLGPKWGPLARDAGVILVGGGIHVASNTSAGHPNG